jgi:hypothetical protein
LKMLVNPSFPAIEVAIYQEQENFFNFVFPELKDL